MEQKRNVYRHSLLLQWILEKVNIIDAELNQPKMGENSSYEGPDMETPKRDHNGRIRENRRSSRLRRRREMSTWGAGALTQERVPSKRASPDDARCDRPSVKRLRGSGSEAASRYVVSGKDIQTQRPWGL